MSYILGYQLICMREKKKKLQKPDLSGHNGVMAPQLIPRLSLFSDTEPLKKRRRKGTIEGPYKTASRVYLSSSQPFPIEHAAIHQGDSPFGKKKLSGFLIFKIYLTFNKLYPHLPYKFQIQVAEFVRQTNWNFDSSLQIKMEKTDILSKQFNPKNMENFSIYLDPPIFHY